MVQQLGRRVVWVLARAQCEAEAQFGGRSRGHGRLLPSLLASTAEHASQINSIWLHRLREVVQCSVHGAEGSGSCVRSCTSNQLLPCNPNVSMSELKTRASVGRAGCTTRERCLYDIATSLSICVRLSGPPRHRGMTVAKSNGKIWREHLHCCRVGSVPLSNVLHSSCYATCGKQVLSIRQDVLQRTSSTRQRSIPVQTRGATARSSLFVCFR